MARLPPRYVVDPDDPRAPPGDVWNVLSPEERALVIASLPSEFPVTEEAAPEGDSHFDSLATSRYTLRRHYQRSGRSIYVGTNLPIYYPGERMFSPDVMAVLDVSLRQRDAWIVSAEGRGLDLAIEIHFRGRRAKDLVGNVDRYAELGIREYFVFDGRRVHLKGYRLPGPEARSYEPIHPVRGLFTSEVLGLELGIEGGQLRFYQGATPVPDADELLERLGARVDELAAAREQAERRAEEEERRAEELAAAREQAVRRAEEAERRLAEALAELERLKRTP